MKIKDLKSTIVSIPFAKPTFWPYGCCDGMTVVVIEIETDQGIIGLGESICIQSSAEAVKLFSERPSKRSEVRSGINCMYDWYDDDYLKGGKMPFEGAYLRVPEDAGLGVELDRQKMSKYHEMYQERGMFSVFGLNPEELRTAPPPLFPSY